MKYELLQPSEWSRVENIFVQNGGLLPSPEVSRIAVAKFGEEIVGFHCLQPALHVEPIWVRPKYRGMVRFRPLLGVLKESVPHGQPFYAFAPNEAIERLCAHLEMSKTPYTVWKGVT
jgi:hypothetical protein